MSRSNDDFDLTKQLNSVSISSDDERIARQLDKTHLAPSNSIFTLPPHIQPLQTQQHKLQQSQPQQKESITIWNQQQDAVAWEGGSTDQWNNNNHNLPWNAEATNKDEGWGVGPPGYTTISQGTYFGFNSIMESPDKANLSKPSESTDASRQAFHRFKNKPVTFNSSQSEQ